MATKKKAENVIELDEAVERIEDIEDAEEKEVDFEKVTPIVFNFDGREYTLEFHRLAVKRAEQEFGVTIAKLQEMQISLLPDMFYCAFMMHHPRVSYERAMEIFDCFGERGELFAALIQLYMKAIMTIMEEPQGKNLVSWKRM